MTETQGRMAYKVMAAKLDSLRKSRDAVPAAPADRLSRVFGIIKACRLGFTGFSLRGLDKTRGR